MLVGGIRREKSRFLVIFYFFLFYFWRFGPGFWEFWYTTVGVDQLKTSQLLSDISYVVISGCTPSRKSLSARSQILEKYVQYFIQFTWNNAPSYTLPSSPSLLGNAMPSALTFVSRSNLKPNSVDYYSAKMPLSH